MNHIWSPWRMDYIMNHDRAVECVFCRAARQKAGPENLVVYRAQESFVILNRYPYTSGHVMVVPFVHVASLDELSNQARAEMMELAAQSVTLLREAYQPQGFNIGVNMGEAAGAGIADHIHLHVVPRWMGDTNFMSSVGQTRVLPGSIDESYQRIRQEWEKMCK